MGYNDYIRNEWQAITLGPDSPHVTLDGMNCWALTRSNDMMITLAYTMTLDDTGNPDDLLHVRLHMETPPALEPVRISCITPHTHISGGSPLYSNLLISLTGQMITCTGFPLTHSRRYDVNVQFFYRVE
jgi:hypothetical protein